LFIKFPGDFTPPSPACHLFPPHSCALLSHYVGLTNQTIFLLCGAGLGNGVGTMGSSPWFRFLFFLLIRPPTLAVSWERISWFRHLTIFLVLQVLGSCRRSLPRAIPLFPFLGWFFLTCPPPFLYLQRLSVLWYPFFCAAKRPSRLLLDHDPRVFRAFLAMYLPYGLDFSEAFIQRFYVLQTYIEVLALLSRLDVP